MNVPSDQDIVNLLQRNPSSALTLEVISELLLEEHFYLSLDDLESRLIGLERQGLCAFLGDSWIRRY